VGVLITNHNFLIFTDFGVMRSVGVTSAGDAGDENSGNVMKI
jgi:hypothetical protein